MKNLFSLTSKTWIRFGLATALISSFSLNTYAQTAPAIQWDKTYGGNGVEAFSSLQQTSDGGYILGGSSNSGLTGDKSQLSKGSSDFWIIKTDVSGNKLWDKTLGGSGYDELTSLQQTSDGGYILAGYSGSGISGDKTQAALGGYDCWVVKTDASGNKLWDKTYGGTMDDRISVIQQTADGGYIFGGSSNSGIGGDKSQICRGQVDYWIIKSDANGNKLWDKTIGGSGDDVLSALQQTPDGGFILGGTSNSPGNGEKSLWAKGNSDYWIVKTDANGIISWDQTIGASNTEELFSLQITSDGGYILGGKSRSLISHDKSEDNKGSWPTYDYWVVKTNSMGNKVWDKTIGGTDNDELTSIIQTSDGGFILGGHSFSNIGADKSENNKGSLQTSDYWIIKLDTSGTRQWDKSFGGNLDDRLSIMQQTLDSEFIFGGISKSGITGDKTQASQGNYDFWIIKSGPAILGTTETQPTFNLSISPNPNHGKFKLQLSNLTTPTAEVTITDLVGRIILHQQLQVTDNQLSEELEIKAAKGMYLLTVQAGTETLTRKIVVE